MKNLIIIVGTVVLGCIIFAMIAGDGNSLKTAGKGMMEKTVEAYEDI